jgi:serine/threonine protein kinase
MLSGKTFGNYQFLEKIGKGSFATVYRAMHIPSSLSVAIKVVPNISPFNPSDEFKLTQKIRHSAIIETFDFFKENHYFFIVMQLFPQGSLSDYIKNYPKLNLDQLKHIFVQVVSAVCYLHSHSICHRDIKISNILIDPEMNVKLIDFGLACSFKSANPSIVGVYGSPYYIAPEVWEDIPYSEKVDVWSLGIFLFRLIFGFRPFDDKDIEKISQKTIHEKHQIPSNAAPALINLFDKVFEKDPKKRISAKELLDHIWLSRVTKPVKIPFMIDEKMILMIEQKGMPTNTIREDILNQKVNEATVFYRILSIAYPQKINTERTVFHLPRLKVPVVRKQDVVFKKNENKLSILKSVIKFPIPIKENCLVTNTHTQMRSSTQRDVLSLF